MRAVIWVQHLLGTGHTVRAAAIAHALRRRGVAVTLLTGAVPPPTLDLALIDVVQLPPVRATDASFRTLVGTDGKPYAAIAGERRTLLRASVEAIAPDILLTETFPLGRRAFASELVPVLAGLSDPRPLVAASVRDVLVRKSPDKEAVMAALTCELFDLVLVHADPAFVRLEDSFAMAPAIAHLTRYTGFVHASATVASAKATGEVIVSSGGGGVGAALVDAAIGAARLGARDLRWRMLVPSDLASSLAAWRNRAPGNVILEPNRPDFRGLLAGAALSVSQAGYNTVLDVLEAGVRAVLVPFAAHEETEQTARADALARRGLATVMTEAELTSERLAIAVTQALAAPLPPRPQLDVSGAETSAAILIDAAERRR